MSAEIDGCIKAPQAKVHRTRHHVAVNYAMLMSLSWSLRVVFGHGAHSLGRRPHEERFRDCKCIKGC